MSEPTKDNPKSKTRANDTRIDVRFPPDIYRAIEHIAEQTGADIHHISQKRILTPTVINLVKLGLNQVADKYHICLSDKISIDVSDRLESRFIALTERIESLECELTELREVTDNISDKMSDNISDSMTDKISDIKSDLKSTPSVVSSVPVQIGTIASQTDIAKMLGFKGRKGLSQFRKIEVGQTKHLKQVDGSDGGKWLRLPDIQDGRKVSQFERIG